MLIEEVRDFLNTMNDLGLKAVVFSGRKDKKRK